MDAGLGRECVLADIGRVAVGRAVEDLVERVRDMGEALELLVGDADLEFVREFRLELQRRDDRDEVGVAAALAEAVERALDLARAGAHRGERIRHRLLGVVMGVDADMARRGCACTTSPTISSTSCGSAPPLVSHSTTQRAPAS